MMNTLFLSEPYASRFRATKTTSINLIPTNGTITPPRPQIKRLRRSRASAPTGRYLTPFRAIGNQQGDDDRVEDHRRQDRRGGRMQPHDVERFQPGERRGEHRRNDGEILGQVVGDGERRQRAAGHQQLLADLDRLR